MHILLNKRTVSLSVVILSLVLLLSGCMPNNYTSREERAFLKAAKNVVSDYLKKQYSGAKIKNIQAETDIASDGFGFDLTEFASGQFTWQDQTYKFLVNTETEQVYTSVYLAEIKEGLKDIVLQSLDIDVSEAAVATISINYRLIIEESDYYVDFTNVFPRKDSAEELLKEILQDTEKYNVSIGIQYKGEGLPTEITKQDVPFPTLSFVTFYHVREEYGLCLPFKYAIIPSLSEEILELKYRLGSPGNYSYTRNQVMEQDGFYVVYNAYERTVEDDVITESVITEEDIAFTVTGEYIDLDCAKNNYVMYLSAADKEKAEKYCYFYYRAPGSKLQINKGMWYTYEDRYVYSDSTYVKIPHKFYEYLSFENTIYTKSASEEMPRSTKHVNVY